MNLSVTRPFFNLFNKVPNPNSVYIDTENTGKILDLDSLVEMSRRKRMMQEAAANVAGRRQELVEQGRMGAQPLVNPQAADKAIMARLPASQAAQIAFQGRPQAAQEIPGIGRRVDYDGGRAVVGRYGTGVATNVSQPDPNRTIEGKPAAQWFAEQAAKQGVSNRFATAVPTGVTDKQDPWGIKPRYTGKAVVEKAMKKKNTA